MRTNRDPKLRLLSTAFPGGGGLDLLRIGRACDIVTIRAGTPLQRADDDTAWCWAILDGAATVSQGDEALALASPGSWVLDGLYGRRTRTSVIAASDVRAAVFRRPEMKGLLDQVPVLASAIRG
jgi:CRP-like cAMP-binding protein